MSENPVPEPKSLAKAYLDLSGMTPARDALREQGRQLAEIIDSIKITAPKTPRVDFRLPAGVAAHLPPSPRLAPIVTKPDRIPQLIESQGRTNELLAEQNDYLASQIGILSEQVEVQKAAAESDRNDTRIALWVAIGFGALNTAVAVAAIIVTIAFSR